MALGFLGFEGPFSGIPASGIFKIGEKEAIMASIPNARSGAKAEHLNFSKVLREELKTLGHAESVRDPIIRAAHRARLSGLAFSGGGIRSATFNLGVRSLGRALEVIPCKRRRTPSDRRPCTPRT